MSREFWKKEDRKNYQDGMELSRQAWKEENEATEKYISENQLFGDICFVETEQSQKRIDATICFAAADICKQIAKSFK